MDRLIQLLAKRVAEAVKERLAPAIPYLRQIGMGMTLIIISSFLWVGGLLFFLIAFFFSLAQLSPLYSYAALWTGSLSMGVALLSIFIGLKMVRPPH